MKFVDLELARRLELAAHPGPGQTEKAGSDAGRKTRVAIAGRIAVFAGANSPMTQAEGLGLNGPVSEEDFRKLEDFFRSHGSAVILEICPMADPAFIEALGTRGYRIVEFTNVLIRDLYAAESSPPPAPGVSVRLTKPEEDRLFAETVARGFAEHFPLTEELISTVQQFSMSQGGGSYLAFVGGTVAGGGTLTLRKGVAGLLGTSTLPEYRRRGVQSNLISARLEAAHAAGCELAMSITQPASGSQRNLERQGFRVVYTRAKFKREWSKCCTGAPL